MTGQSYKGFDHKGKVISVTLFVLNKTAFTS